MDEAWGQVGIDLIGPLPETASGHKYVMTLMDYYTKWAEAAPLKDKTALSVAEALYSVSVEYLYIIMHACISWLFF